MYEIQAGKTTVAMKNVGYAKRGYHYVKDYGMTKLYRKAQERLQRDGLEKGYQDWLAEQRPAKSELMLQREHRFAYRPLISVIVPLYRTRELYLRQMIESVLNQTYGNLELCLADGSGGDTSVGRVVQGYARQDKRVRYRKLPDNRGISENTNAALDMARGEYLAFLDHDDTLEDFALFEIVKYLQEYPDTDMLYTDEDKMSGDSASFFQPHFKPDFNPALLRSNNYICHLLVVKKELADCAGRFCSRFDGSQDYDFILRCSERAGRIGHIPRILYHWRCHEDSTASNPESKAYAYKAGKRAVEEHLERLHIRASVEQTDSPGFYRVNYELESVPKVCIVLLDVPGLKTFGRFLRAVNRSRSYANLEVLALLEAPEKNKLILNFLKQHRQIPIKVVYCNSACNKFVTFSRLAGNLDSEYLLFMGSRLEKISRGFVETFLGSAMRPQTGAVGGRVYGSDRRLRYGAKILGLNGFAGDAFAGLKLGYSGYFHKAVLQQNFHAVSDRAMMVRKEYFLRVGGFSEDVEDRMKDVDLCLKLEGIGLKNIYEPGIVLITRERAVSRKKTARQAQAFGKKWSGILSEPDGCYNSNLSLEHTDYRIAGFRKK